MKVYNILRPETIRVSEQDLPEIQDDEALIEVSHVGLCGSDVHLYLGSYKGPFNYPVVFGHEWSGKVVKTGKKVGSVREGDRVTGDCSRFCGECSFCKEDRNLCRNIEKFGITIDGASAEYIVRREKYLYRAPDEIDLSLLALTEPLAVSAHLLSKIESAIGSFRNHQILIFGAGAIGLGTLLLLKNLYGVQDVTVYDIADERLAVAKELGASILQRERFEQKSGGESYQSLYDADYDLIIETTGAAAVFARAFEMVKPLGIIGCIGMTATASIEQKLIVTKGLRIIGSIGGTGDFPGVIKFIHQNSGIVNKLVSHRIPVTEADRAFQLSKDKKFSLKILLEF